MPGWSRQALVTAVLLVVVAGCGRQDRYTVTGEPISPARWLPLGSLSEIDRVPTGHTYYAGDGWSSREAVMVGAGGRVTLVNDAGFEVLPRPTTRHLTGVHANADGSVDVVGSDGLVRTWSGGAWSEIADLGTALGWIGRDGADRRLVLSDYRKLLWRQDGAAWTEFEPPTPLDDFRHVMRLRDGRVLVTMSSGVRLELTEAALVVSDSLPHPVDYNHMGYAESGQGQLACFWSNGKLGFRRDDGWEMWTNEQTGLWPDAIFYRGETLMTIAGGGLFAWHGAGWTRQGDAGWVYDAVGVVADADGVLLLGHTGGLDRVDAGGLTPLSSSLREMAGVVEVEGRLLLHADEGVLLRQDAVDPARWRVVAETGRPTYPDRRSSAVLDDGGNVLLRGRESLFTWTAETGLVAVPVPDGRPVLLARQADGEVLVLADGGLYSWRRGVLARVADESLPDGGVLGLRRLGPDRFEVALTNERVERFGPDGVVTDSWIAVDWDLRQLHDLGEGRGLLLGGIGAREIVGDEVRDITPYRSGSSGDLEAQYIWGAASFDDGRLLCWSWTSDRFMIRDEGEWWLVQDSFERSIDWAPMDIVRAGDGFVGFDQNVIVRFDPEDSAP